MFSVFLQRTKIMIYMEKAFGVVCFFRGGVDVSQMLSLKASFHDHSLPFSTTSDEARQWLLSPSYLCHVITE